MKILGALTELNPEIAAAVPIAAAAGGLDQSIKKLVTRYLSHGTCVLDVMEASPDPRQPGASIAGGASLLTDGVWSWRADLVAYIEAYSIALPPAFLESVLLSNGKPQTPELHASIIQQVAAAWGWPNPFSA
ncbi:MAG: hypothetical protein LBE21_10225 [Pseudomonadales bacterium]|jgi:hypothetical protein|nr:hypothetical protein [Pseudomonadales bacterium]